MEEPICWWIGPGFWIRDPWREHTPWPWHDMLANAFALEVYFPHSYSQITGKVALKSVHSVVVSKIFLSYKKGGFDKSIDFFPYIMWHAIKINALLKHSWNLRKCLAVSLGLALACKPITKNVKRYQSGEDHKKTEIYVHHGPMKVITYNWK